MANQIQEHSSRQRKILEAAARVFEREGFSNASMRAIAKEAGCTTGAIYPHFKGKEDIYGHLLETSLRELHVEVAKAVAGEIDPGKALVAAGLAFNEHYSRNRFEVDLGLYLFNGLETKGLGRERDSALNNLLLQTLEIFKVCFTRLAPASLADEALEQWALNERDALFAHLIGILMLSRTGRDRSIGTDAESILKHHLGSQVDRFLH